MSDYGDYRIANAPPWLQGPAARSWFTQLGLPQDALYDVAKQAIKARFPLLAPPDALTQLGAERGLPRAAGDTDAQYAARLQAAWDTWPNAGTALGLLRALSAMGYPGAVLLQQVGPYASLDAGGNLVLTGNAGAVFDTNTAFWSRFSVILSAPFPAAWYVASVLTAVASNSDEMNRVRAAIAKWKPAHATCVRIVALFSGRLLGYPQRLLGSGGTLGGATGASYTP